MEDSKEDIWKSSADNVQHKGLWTQMLDEKAKGNIQKYNTKKFNLADMRIWMEDMWKADKERKERLDKEYTDLSQVTVEDIDEIIAKWGGIDNVPNGLLAKVKLGGNYMDIPVKLLKQYQQTVVEMVKTLTEVKEQ